MDLRQLVLSYKTALHNLEADDADGLPGGAAEAAGAMALLVALADGNEGSDDPA